MYSKVAPIIVSSFGLLSWCIVTVLFKTLKLVVKFEYYCNVLVRVRIAKLRSFS